MKKYTLLGHVFTMEDRAYQFITSYQSRIQEYTQSHETAADIVEDIHYRIIELLYTHETPVTESQVISVANTIGEPEAIFGDDQVVDIIPKRNGLYKQKPMIRGVCYWISTVLGVPVHIVRIVFILGVVFWGLSIWTYAIAALFVPYHQKKGNLFFEIIRIGLWMMVIGGLVASIVAPIIATGFVGFTPVIDNQSFLALVPSYIIQVTVAVILGLLLLLYGSIGALLKRSWLNTKLAFVTVVMIVIGLITIGGIGYRYGFGLINNVTTVTNQIDIVGDQQNIKSITASIINSPGLDRIFDGNFGSTSIVIKPTSGSQVTSTVETRLTATSTDQLTKTLDLYQLPKINIMSGELNITFPTETFSKVVPYAFVDRTITLYVPTSTELIMGPQNQISQYVQDMGYNREIKSPSSTGSGTQKIEYECVDYMAYIYNQETDQFVCRNSRIVDRSADQDNYDDYYDGDY